MTSYTLYFDGETATAEFSVTNPESVTIGDTATYEFEFDETNYDVVKKYRDYDGSVSVNELLNGDARYRDYIPTGATVSSLLVGIEPSTDLQNKDVPGIWGVIEELQDRRNTALSTNRLSVSVRVLSPFERYADHTTAVSNLRR